MKKNKAVGIDVGGAACLAEAIRNIDFNYLSHLKKASRIWSLCNPLSSERILDSSPLPLQSNTSRAHSPALCRCMVPDTPPQGRLKVVNQAGVDHSTAWWSWDQLQRSQFRSFQYKMS